MAKFAVFLKVRVEAILAVDVLELRPLPSRHSSAHHAQGTLVSPASCTSGIRSFACLRAISTQANRPSTPAATTSRQRFAHSGREIRLTKLAGLPETCIVTSLTVHVTKLFFCSEGMHPQQMQREPLDVQQLRQKTLPCRCAPAHPAHTATSFTHSSRQHFDSRTLSASTMRHS